MAIGKDSVVFASPEFQYLQLQLCEQYGLQKGEIRTQLFPNGEVHRVIGSDPSYADKDVVILGSTDDRDMLGFLDVARELASTAGSLQVVIPYYRYSTQERRKHVGEIITAQTRAALIAALPETPRGNRVSLYDIHSPKVTEFFSDQGVSVQSVNCEDTIARAIASYIEGDLVIGSADGGRDERIEALARRLRVPFALVKKERLSGSETRLIGEMSGNVRGKIVVITDDMIRSGGTALDAARSYRENGAAGVWLVATHGDFAPGALEKLKASGFFTGVIVTDSWGRGDLRSDSFVKVVPIVPEIGRSLGLSVREREQAVSEQVPLPEALPPLPRLETLVPQEILPPKKERAMRVLLLVDVQNDFCPGGSLAVADGDQVVAVLNRMMREGDYDLIVATKDWHPRNHGSFAINHPGARDYDLGKLGDLPQVYWPAHGVQATPGAEFHRDLDVERINKIIYKGTNPNFDSYSGFADNGKVQETELREYLQEQAKLRGLTLGDIDLDVGGLATEYCVKYTALDARELGIRTRVIVDACRAVNLEPGDDVKALREMQEAGVQLVQSRDRLVATRSIPQSGYRETRINP